MRARRDKEALIGAGLAGLSTAWHLDRHSTTEDAVLAGRDAAAAILAEAARSS